MTYDPVNWKNRVVERPRTYHIQNNPDGTVTLIPAPGQVYEEGTPVDALHLNKMEQGFIAHLADNTPHDGFVVPISHLNESSIKHITESGSNANGSYIKFDDGTMICVSTTRNVTNISSASGGVFRSPMSAWTLPATFINTDYVFTGTGNPAWVGLGGTKNTTSISYYAYSSTSFSGTVAVNLLAIGRWK